MSRPRLRFLASNSGWLVARFVKALSSTWRVDVTGLEHLQAVRDEDPLVRVAVVTRLEDADGFAVVRGIVSALEDSDPRVVLRAIAAVEMLQDETLIPELGALAGDDDASVRQAAEKAIEFLGG